MWLIHDWHDSWRTSSMTHREQVLDTCAAPCVRDMTNWNVPCLICTWRDSFVRNMTHGEQVLRMCTAPGDYATHLDQLTHIHSFICDMTDSYETRPHSYATRLIQMQLIYTWHGEQVLDMCAGGQRHTLFSTYAKSLIYSWHYSFICDMTSFICDTTHSNVTDLYMTWRTGSRYVCRAGRQRFTLGSNYAKPLICSWHDALICDMCIHMRHDSFIRDMENRF